MGGPTWRDELAAAAQLLGMSGVDAPMREARWLLADVLGVDRAELILREDQPPEPDHRAAWSAALARRAAGEPLSRIRGWKEFYGRRFQVTRDVLDPRPETEHLVEAALERLPKGGRVLDLGTGSGCILVSVLAERPDASGVGLDVSEQALNVARLNAFSLGASARAEWALGDFDALDGLGEFDMVVSNPPYIPTGDIAALDIEVRAHDPGLALDGGEDGLAAYRRIIPAAMGVLAPGGWLALEVGAGQADAVRALLLSEGWLALGVRRDLGGHDRVVEGRKPF